MYKFMLKTAVAAILGVAALCVVLAVRVATWQSRVNAHYCVSSDIRVIAVGNSHTGCNISEEAEFHTRNFWCAARGALFSLMRLKELERQGQLAHVQCCLVDCGLSCIAGFDEDTLIEQFIEEFPMAWRYFWMMPVNKCKLLFKLLLGCGQEYKLTDTRPDDDIPWTDRTPAEQEKHISKISPCLRTLSSPPMCKDCGNVVCNTLCEISELCQRHGIRVVFFASPTISSHPSKVNPERYQAWQVLLNEISTSGVEYLDCTSWCDDALFRDADHLTKLGAKCYTGILFGKIQLFDRKL